MGPRNRSGQYEEQKKNSNPSVAQSAAAIPTALNRLGLTKLVIRLCWEEPKESKHNKKLRNSPWSESASELYRPNDRRLSAKLVPTFLPIGACRVVSAADPYGRNIGFSRPQPLTFLSSSSSIVLTRLSGPRSRPTTSHKIS
jgi:hypothetical protein